MSIIIRALTKADNTRKKEKKRIAIHRLPFLSTYNSKRKNNPFLFGLITGFGIIALCTGCFFVGGVVMKRYTTDSTAGKQHLTQTEIAQFDQELLELEVERELILHNGPDIEEELALEQSTIIEPDKAVTQKQIIRIYDKTTEETIVQDHTAVNFPDFFVSGVVWDFHNAFVFVNGVPFMEHEVCNGVRIEKITVSQLYVTYNNEEYEIVLQ